jgi:Alpha/beta hydrolase of unknown function (DUF900)
MNRSILSALVLTYLALSLVIGCTSNRPYRTGFNAEDPTQPGPNPTNSVIEATPDYKLGFVEFDDQGWFWDLKQKSAVEQMIRKECGIGTSKEAAVFMVLFVHGWKNNAAFDDTNVETFRTVLKQLSDLEKTFSQKEQRTPRKLIGIYAGWRGLSIKSDYFPPLGKELTIWSRKNAAQRVGGYGAMTELMMDLEELQRTNNNSLPTNVSQSKLVIIGHSLGADAVYNAISHIITERFVDTIKQSPGELLKPLGDQVILLNPAFEAARFYDLEQLARSVRDYAPNQRPVLSVFQSEGDWATHSFFPIGATIATVFQRHRSAFQKQANHESVGWFGPFITHELRYSTNAAGSSTGGTNAPPTGKHELRTWDKLPGTADNIIAQRRAWRFSSAQLTTNVFGNCILTSKPNYRPRNPIVVVSVDTQIMKDHDDIGNPVLINFVQEYIPFCDDEPAAIPVETK